MKLTYKTERFEIELDVTEKELQHLVDGLSVWERLKQLDIISQPKDELSPDWDNAPKGAMYWAVDEVKDCYWYEDKPVVEIEDGIWDNETGWCEFDKKIENELLWFDWQSTLRKRPQ